ncbi:acyl-CoA dehydrogenase family protein [Dactylosporangium sp. NPDC048998]|uniref:acyl-CoA dehydrogenase family protein n=1 Tax=Dactylosporangium sp. NPDC048998 TaxID=3363976 RepID=UPI003714EB0E
MTELDDRLTMLRGAAAEMAPELRRHALAVDADPYCAIGDLTAHRTLTALTTPARYAEPLRIGRHTFPAGSCLAQVVCTIEFGRADAGTMLTWPGPGLAGRLLDELGDPDQCDYFYRALAQRRTGSFFAMTEAGRGSDATALETALEPDGDGYRLRGAKRYVGNAAHGGVGVIFARTGPGPLSIRAALVTVPAPGLSTQRLETVGLRGARLAAIDLDGVPVGAEMLLGRHLPVSRRGLWGAMRVFHHMRVNVAALAAGTAQAVLDLVAVERPGARGLDVLSARSAECRQLLYAAGHAVDHARSPADSSTAKLSATRLAWDAVRFAIGALGPLALIEQPLLEKWARDVCAFEFMEGTSDIQRQHIAREYIKATPG